MNAGCAKKLWDPLRTRAIPERLKGVFTIRRYTNTRLLYLYLTWVQNKLCLNYNVLVYFIHISQQSERGRNMVKTEGMSIYRGYESMPKRFPNSQRETSWDTVYITDYNWICQMAAWPCNRTVDSAGTRTPPTSRYCPFWQADSN